MAGKYERRRKFSPLPLILTLLIAAIIALCVILLKGGFSPSTPETPTNPQSTVSPDSTSDTNPPEDTTPPETEPPVIDTTASFVVTGDLLMHRPVFESCWRASEGTWIFDPIFEHIVPYVQEADYAVANLETTLCGDNNGYTYGGFPQFNCPDGIATSAKDAGFDMFLTVNNHCYDTRVVGIQRTLDVLSKTGLESLGTQMTAEDPDYKVIEINGIKVGMTAYTYETGDGLPDIPSINTIQCNPNSFGLINSFDYGNLDRFYEKMSAHLEAMRAEGAEAIVVFMHWGEEYQTAINGTQKKMAQQLCDMGVDVIVGGHPHVIQPTDLLTSTLDENHKTLIIYSTGNAVSNQRIHEMRLKTGHTEDGILFRFTLVRYIDGTVMVQSADAIPTWVNMPLDQSLYAILPLDNATRDQWQDAYGIGNTTYAACEASYDRTMALVGNGLEKAQAYFDTVNEEKIYQLRNPELFPEPAETESTAPTEVTEPSESIDTPTE